MTAKTKKILIISGIVLAVGGIATFFLLRNRKKGAIEEVDLNIPVQPTSSGSSKPSYPSTPFFNKEQGDKFRAWINKYYPQYAKANEIDPKGEFNNAYIRKAWAEYGERYKAQNPNYLKGTLKSTVNKQKKLTTDEYIKQKPDLKLPYSFPSPELGDTNKPIYR